MLCSRIWMFLKKHSTVPGALLIFSAVYVLVLAVETGANGAAWVQAIGAVVAIGVSIWISSSQYRLSRKDKQRDEYENVVLAINVAAFAKSAIEEAAKNLKGGLNLISIRRHVVLLDHALNDIGAIPLPKDAGVADQILSLRRCLVELIAVFNIEYEDPGKNDFSKFLDRVIKRAFDVGEGLTSAMVTYSRRVDHDVVREALR